MAISNVLIEAPHVSAKQITEIQNLFDMPGVKRTRTKSGRPTKKARMLVPLMGPSTAGPVIAAKSRSAASLGDDLKFYLGGLPASFTAIGNTWAEFEPLQAIAAGDDAQNRHGRQIYVDRLEIRGTLVGAQSNSIGDDAYNTVRIVVATYKGATAGAITPLATASYALQVPLLQGVVPVDKVYTDKTFVMNTNGLNSTGYVPVAKYIRLSIPIRRVFDFLNAFSNSCIDHLVISMISDSTAIPHVGFNSMQIIPYFRG